MIRFWCFTCQRQLKAHESEAGSLIACSGCGSKVYVPRESDAQAAQPPDVEPVDLKPVDEERVEGAGDDLGTEAISFLDAVEKAIKGMIFGTARFIAQTIPNWLYGLFRNFFIWLGKAIRFLGRFSVKLVRVLVVLSVWLAMVFGPLVLTLWLTTSNVLAIASGAWAFLGLSGSIWGLRRWMNQKRALQKASMTGCAVTFFILLAFGIVAAVVLGFMYSTGRF